MIQKSREHSVIKLNFKNAHAILESSISYHKSIVTEIIGTLGKIIIYEPWHKAEGYILHINDHELDIKNSKRIQLGFLNEDNACI